MFKEWVKTLFLTRGNTDQMTLNSKQSKDKKNKLHSLWSEVVNARTNPDEEQWSLQSKDRMSGICIQDMRAVQYTWENKIHIHYQMSGYTGVRQLMLNAPQRELGHQLHPTTEQYHGAQPGSVLASLHLLPFRFQILLIRQTGTSL